MTMFLLPASIFIAGCFALYIFLFVGRRGRNFPPGPPTLPVIGNLHQLPASKVYLQFTEWVKVYGGMYTLKLGPATAVVLTDRRIIKQLMDKRSAISSNRPVSYVSQKLVTQSDHLLWMNNDTTWRMLRKLIHQDLTENLCIKEHTRIQHAETVQMLHDIIQTPDDWTTHLKRFSNSIIMTIVYGIRTPSCDAPHSKRLNALVEIWARINEFGATPPVDFYPLLKSIPERWLGNWITRATTVRDELDDLYLGLLQSIIKRRETLGSVNCIMDRLLDQGEKNGMTTHQIALLGGVAIKGGSDTSATCITSCIQALIAFPDVQKKAQEELDSVVGEDRCPDWSDYSKLPYVATLIKEAMRWRPVAPLGVPHALSEDQWVDGKFLPKGTTCFINVWGLHHDEAKFPNSHIFDPDRYKGRTLLAAEYANSADYEERDHYGYGNGRRLCPGIHLADRNLYQAISKLIWAFSFEKKIDSKTNMPIEMDTDIVTGYREGLTACAYDFPCSIKVRSEKKRATIMREFAEAQETVFPQYEKAQFF